MIADNLCVFPIDVADQPPYMESVQFQLACYCNFLVIFILLLLKAVCTLVCISFLKCAVFYPYDVFWNLDYRKKIVRNVFSPFDRTRCKDLLTNIRFFYSPCI